jgi:hypothetical protein
MSAGYYVRRTNNIGVTGTRVSDSRANRRTIKNIGTTNLEIVETQGAAFGGGYPLAPGAAFNFDDAGMMDGPIFVASESAGGAVAVLGY